MHYASVQQSIVILYSDYVCSEEARVGLVVAHRDKRFAAREVGKQDCHFLRRLFVEGGEGFIKQEQGGVYLLGVG